jgi:GntR family transcriptional repressor for pyruvate dehydrogenase complex
VGKANDLINPINPVRRTVLIDEVVGQLEDLITSGTVKQGDRLPSETDLAKQLGVGRGTAREALIVLCARGLLTRSRRGTFVASVDRHAALLQVTRERFVEFTQMEQLVETRQLLEAELAALCAARCTDDDLTEMTRCVERMADAEGRGDVADFSNADAEFHFLVAQGAQNEILAAMQNLTRDLLVKVIMELLANDKDLRTRALSFHRSILDAISKENPNLARNLTVMHIADVSQAMSRLRPSVGAQEHGGQSRAASERGAGGRSA